MSNLRLLVVDDHPDTLKLFDVFFSLAGFDVVSATNGADALHEAGNGIDVIATDLAMPGIDGFEFIRRLRAARSKSPIPIVAVSGQVDPDRVSATDIGCCRLVQKPCPLDHLADMLRSLASTCVHDCTRCPNRAD